MEKIFEKPNKIIFNSTYDSTKYIATCTKCGHIEPNVRETPIVTCPKCNEKYKASELIRIYSRNSLNCYSTIDYGYIEKVTLTDKCFSIVYKLYTTEIYGLKEDNNLNYSTKEDILEFTVRDEKLKTKEAYNTKSRFFINGEEIKFSKSKLNMFSNCINTYEFVNLGITVPSLNLNYMLNDINTTFKKYREYIELGLGSLEGKNWDNDLIEKMKSSEYYSNLIYKEVNEQIKNNTEKAKTGLWINTTYVNSLISKYPYTEKEYYDIYNRISNMNTYYTEDLKDLKYLNDYHYKHLALLFFNYKYTEEEQDLFLQMMYKQAFPSSKIATLTSHLKYTKDLEIPFVKLPKELEIYTERLVKISSYIQREKLSSCKELNILDNKYTLMVNDNKETAIKALSYNNNFALLNKILYDYNYKNNLVSLVKNTDYIIVYSLINTNGYVNSKYAIHKIYDKDKEITDKKKIIEILDSIVKEKGGDE